MLYNMKSTEDNILTLGNFEGPIDFLLHLIQKNELDITEISLREITAQYINRLQEMLSPEIDNAAEFVGTAASLLLMKSKTLLPKHEQTSEIEEELLDPQFEIIHKLIDYCRFKEVAKALKEREEQQGVFYSRGAAEPPEQKKGLGVEHLSLSDLANLFQHVLSKASSSQGVIKEEIWKVSDQMQLIRCMLLEISQIRFEVLFPMTSCREELIVNFLAVLELMKQGEASIVKEIETGIILIIQANRP